MHFKYIYTPKYFILKLLLTVCSKLYYDTHNTHIYMVIIYYYICGYKFKVIINEIQKQLLLSKVLMTF